MTNDQQIPTEGSQSRSDHKQSATQKYAPAREGWRWPDLASLIFDGILTVTAVAGTYFLIGQSRQMQRSNELAADALKQTKAAISEAQEANRIARDAATRAAQDSKAQSLIDEHQLKIAKATADHALAAVKAAQEANANSSKAFRTDQRPWVLVNTIKLEEIKPGDTAVKAELVIGNLGRSPAMDLAFDYVGVVVKPPLSPFPPGPISNVSIIQDGKRIPLTPVYGNSDVMGPSSTQTIQLQNAINNDSIADLKRGVQYAYVYGVILYADLFGDTHSTRFCYISDALQAPVGTNIVQHRVRPCPGGNKAQ